MWYNLQWYFRVIYNLVRLPLVFLINRGRVRFAIVQKLSPGASIIVGKRGKIELRPRVIAERGSLIQCMGGKLTLGYKTYVNRNSLIVCHTGISVGDYTTIGPNVCIFDHDHDLENRNQFIAKPIEIGSHVWIGSNVTILKGAKIGDGAVIAAGTIVTKNVPANTIVSMDISYRFKEIKR